MGVVTLKAALEAVAFAVPVGEVVELQRNAKRSPYAVTDKLSSWEKVHNPLAALQRRSKKYDPKMVVKVPGKVRKMVLSRGGTAIYLLMANSGAIHEFQVGTRKLGRTFKCDMVLSDFIEGPARGNELLACSPTSRKLVRVDLRTMRVKQTSSIDFAPMLLDYVGGFNKWVGVATYDARGQSVKLVRWTDLGDKAASQFLTLRAMDTRLGFWADGRHLVSLGIAPDNLHLRLQACPVLTADYLLQIEEARRMSARPGANAAQYRKRISTLNQAVTKSLRTYEMDGRLMLKEGVFLPVLRFVDRDRLVFARRFLHVGFKIRKIGEFGLPLEAKALKGDSSDVPRRLAQAMSNVFSVSPCGTWAATGTHIYNVSTLKPIRRLPFTATRHVFSRNGKDLFIYDATHTSIYTLLDWRKNAPELEESVKEKTTK
jgi:hypothetical protein